MNETLEAMARALFKSWFVDFDPVRAKAEGRARQDGARSGQPRKPLNAASDLSWPGAEAGAGAEGDPGLPKPLADLFPARLVDSELGEIPEGWSASPLYDIATYINGAAYAAFQPNDERRGLRSKIAELKAGSLATRHADAQPCSCVFGGWSSRTRSKPGWLTYCSGEYAERHVCPKPRPVS